MFTPDDLKKAREEWEKAQPILRKQELIRNVDAVISRLEHNTNNGCFKAIIGTELEVGIDMFCKADLIKDVIIELRGRGWTVETYGAVADNGDLSNVYKFVVTA